jgi:hypothetical protein
MKKLLILLPFTFLIFHCSFSQSVGIGTTTPAASAQLDITSNNKGMLVPRLNTAQRTGIASPATGLLVYDTDSTAFAYYTGSAWVFIKGINSVANDWNTLGNSGTNAASNFIGTTDNIALKFRTANTSSGEIHPTTGNTSLGFNSTPLSGGGSNTALGSAALANNRVA